MMEENMANADSRSITASIWPGFEKPEKAYALGDKRELFVDDFFIDSLNSPIFLRITPPIKIL
jgi:hypothetical protein